MVYRTRKLSSVFIILLTFGMFCFIPSVYAQNTDYIERPIGANSFVSVVNHTDIRIEVHLTFANPFNEVKRVNMVIPISWILRQGRGEIYITDEIGWLPINETNEAMQIEFDLSPFGSQDVIFKTILENRVGVTNGVNHFEFESFLEDAEYNKVEFHIPIYKGWDKIEITGYSTSPDDEDEHAGFYIIRWDASSYSKYMVLYTYAFPLEDYLFNPWLMLVVGALFGFGLERAYHKYRDKKLKQKKK